MRKTFMLVLAMLLVSIGVFAVLPAHVAQDEDAITVTETVLYGERASAEGARLVNHVTAQELLFWDTEFAVGNTLTQRTDFRFYHSRPTLPSADVPAIDIYCNLNYSFLNSVDFDRDGQSTPMKAAIDVASRTPNGQTHTETVALSDYYSIWPVALAAYGIDIPQYIIGSEEQILTDYLQIPTPPDQTLTVTVSKNYGGTVSGLESALNGDDPPTFRSIPTLLIDDTFYFALSDFDRFAAGAASLPANRVGLHALPLVPYNGRDAMPGTKRQGVEQLRLAYPLPSGTRMLQLIKSSDGTRVLLLTQLAQSFTLHVLDSETMQPIQVYPLPPQSGADTFWRLQQYDNFLAVVYENGSFCILPDQDGIPYAVSLTGSLRDWPGPAQANPTDELVMAYDGTRLAVALFSAAYPAHDVYLLVYSGDGLSYVGEYSYTGSARDNFVQPVYSQPLNLEWKDG